MLVVILECVVVGVVVVVGSSRAKTRASLLGCNKLKLCFGLAVKVGGQSLPQRFDFIQTLYPKGSKSAF
jgi:hypothetical protein